MVLYYNVRESSMDVDGSWDVNNVVVNKAIDYAADINNINKSWLNSDYEKSPSYTPAIYTNSIFYDQIHNVRFHIVRPELALCMKIIAFRGRRGKYDRADAHSLVALMRQNGIDVNMESIIDWMETFYKPVPELSGLALGFIKSLG